MTSRRSSTSPWPRLRKTCESSLRSESRPPRRFFSSISRHPILALESNGLRVLVRLGYAPEHRNYSTMYKNSAAGSGIAVAGKLRSAHPRPPASAATWTGALQAHLAVVRQVSAAPGMCLVSHVSIPRESVRPSRGRSEQKIKIQQVLAVVVAEELAVLRVGDIGMYLQRIAVVGQVQHCHRSSVPHGSRAP